MTLTLTFITDTGLSVLKMYLHIRSKVYWSKHSKVRAWTDERDTPFVPVTLTLTRWPWYATVTDIFWYIHDRFEIIWVFYFTRNHVWNWNKSISAAKRILKLFQNYFSDIEHVGKYSWAAISFWYDFEIILGKFPRAEIKLFQSEPDSTITNIRVQ